MAAPRVRRTQFLVERGFQFRFTRWVIFYVFISCAATALTIFYTTFWLLGEKLADVYPQGRLISIYRSVHAAFLIEMLILVPLIFVASIFFSHKIVGHLPKIYQALREIGNGRFDVKIQLRRNDELRELANVVNEVAENLRQRQGKT